MINLSWRAGLAFAAVLAAAPLPALAQQMDSRVDAIDDLLLDACAQDRQGASAEKCFAGVQTAIQSGATLPPDLQFQVGCLIANYAEGLPAIRANIEQAVLAVVSIAAGYSFCFASPGIDNPMSASPA